MTLGGWKERQAVRAASPQGSETTQPSVECGFHAMPAPSSGLGSKFGSRLGVSEAHSVRVWISDSAGVGKWQVVVLPHRSVSC